ncbi:MAG: OmpA family protein [Elusimicrobiales bacterium]|nr:OmpA family protein [Elusimicrobiales bacterium]
MPEDIYKNRREELENQLNKGALWAVTYGDLMSYLMIFFLMMFSFSIAKTDKSKSRKYEESLANIQKSFGGKVDKKRMERAQAQETESKMENNLKESMAAGGISNLVQIQSNARMVKLVLTEGVLFSSGASDLKEPAKKVLAPIAAELKKLPNDVIIEGHTDNVPIKHGRYSSNWELSMARAYSVLQYMATQGIQSNHLAGIGYGDTRPVGDNARPEGRAKNRRIEISLMKTD